MPVKNKNPNPITPILKSPAVFQEPYFANLPSYRLLPVSEKTINQLVKRLEEVAYAISHPESTYRTCKIGQIIRLLGYCPRSVEKWCDSYPKLKTAYEDLLRALGDMREQRGLERMYDSAIVRASMYHYDKNWPSQQETPASMTTSVVFNAEKPSLTTEVTNQIDGKTRDPNKPQ